MGTEGGEGEPGMQAEGADSIAAEPKAEEQGEVGGEATANQSHGTSQNPSTIPTV
jgi:hypothetical protein